jgi:hypothetical protein
VLSVFPAIGLALVWCVAAAFKFADLTGTRLVAEKFRLGGLVARAAPIGLPLAELLVSAALLVPVSRIYGAAGSALLLVLFAALLTREIIHGETDTSCHCFGRLSATSLSWRHVLVDFVLLAISLVVFFGITSVVLSVSSLAALAAITLSGLWNLARRRNHLTERDRSVSSAVVLKVLGDRHLNVGGWYAVIMLTPYCEQCRTVLRHRLDDWTMMFGKEIQFFALVESDDATSFLPCPTTEEAHRAVLVVPVGTAQRIGFNNTPAAVVVNGHGQLLAGPVFGTAAISIMLRDANAACYQSVRRP